MAINRSVNRTPTRRSRLQVSGHSSRGARRVRRARRRGRRRDRESGACTFDPRCSSVRATIRLSDAGAGGVGAGDVRRCIASGDAGAGVPGTRARIGARVERHRRRAADGLAIEAFVYVIAKDPSWDGSRFDASPISTWRACRQDDVLNSSNPDMKAFFARGGKLLLYHGWSDAQVTPLNTIDFFNKVVACRVATSSASRCSSTWCPE